MHQTTYIPSRLQRRHSQFEQLNKVFMTAIAMFLVMSILILILPKVPEVIYFYKNC